jgi:hypothetical protein
MAVPRLYTFLEKYDIIGVAKTSTVGIVGIKPIFKSSMIKSERE